MTDRELLQMALDALEEYCEHSVLLRPIERRDALRARLEEPEPVIYARKEGDLIVVDLPQVPTGGGGISKDEQPELTRKWVGLTDEEIWKDDGIMAANSGYGANFETLRELARAIEAKLKEKNT
jgi:hypothetical protein